MTHRYKVIKECFDSEGRTIPVGTILKLYQGGVYAHNLDLARSGQRWYRVKREAVTNTLFFKEVSYKVVDSIEYEIQKILKAE